MAFESVNLPTLEFSGVKGLHTDSLPNNQPPGTYTYARDVNAREDLTRESLSLPAFSAQLPGEVLGMWPLNGETLVMYRVAPGIGGVGSLRISPTGSVFSVHWESALLLLAGPVVMRARLDYRGHRIVYFTDNVNPVRKLDLDGPRPVQADDMNLILHNPLPTIDSWQVLDGGALPAGMYQVLARLLTSARAATPFNIGTPLIPLSARPSTAPWPQQDGGLNRPGSEQLQITVRGIAPGFRYVQLAVVTYDPNTLAPDVRLQEPVEISPTQTEATLLVSRLPDTAATAAELTTEAVNIKTVQLLEEAKDSLLLSNVTVQREDGFDWQAVANKIAVFWTTTPLATVPPKPVIVDRVDTSTNQGAPPLYYDASVAATLKSLQRGEVYSLALSPIIDGERTQAAFHIPAGVAVGAQAAAAWVSQERYPVNRGFPTDSTGQPAFIRHHKMPSLVEAPLTQNVNANGFSYDNNSAAVNVLGLRIVLPLDLLDLIPAEQRKRLTGFRILRQPRPVADSTILATGLAQTMLSYENVLFPSPFSGYYRRDGDGVLSGWSRQGTFSPNPNDHLYQVKRDRLAFYSLDTLLGGVDITAAQRVNYVALLTGRAWLVDTKRTNDEDEDEGGKFVESFVSLTQTDSYTIRNAALSYPLDQSLTQHIGSGDPFATDINIGDTAGAYSLRNQNGYELLALDNSSGAYPNGFSVAHLRTEFEYSNRTNATDEVFGYNQQEQSFNQDDLGSQLVPAIRYLAQLTRSLPAQYGRIEQASYLEVGSTGLVPGSTTNVFRGDVFVQPCGILLTSQERKWNYDQDEDNKNGPFTRQLVWFFCENRVNAGRRHFDAPREGFQGTTPYYPFSKVLANEAGTGLLQLPTVGGHAVGYNKTFSLEDRLTRFFPRLLSADAIVDAFHNRTYYTVPLVEGALSDNWQTVRANDYYDLPATRGYLTDVFVQGGIVFQRTKQTLYRAFFKETTFNVTTSGPALLGTGLAFAQPSQELLTADDGYAGGERAGSCNSLAGRVLVDSDRLQLFLFNGSQPQELLRITGCIKAFEDLLATGPVTAGVYHPLDKAIYLFTKTAGLVYSLTGQQFVGYSSFGANVTCTTNKHVVIAQGSTLYNLNLGQPSPDSRLHFTGAPLGGKREAAYYNAMLHAEPLPAASELATPTQNVRRTFRRHQGYYDVFRNELELVAVGADQHYNFELPVDQNQSFLQGNYFSVTLQWDKPMQFRSLDVTMQLAGPTQG